MAATIDMNFQSDLMAIFEENLFWGEEQLKRNCKKKKIYDSLGGAKETWMINT